MALELGQPPVLPPSVSNQMGGAASPGIGSMVRSMGRSPEGASPTEAPRPETMAQTHPQGAFLAHANVLKRLLAQMARMFPKFSATADQMARLLDSGSQEVLSGSAGEAGAEPQPGRGGAPEGDVSMSFPG